MSREIKFRGLRIDTNTWIYGYCYKHLIADSWFIIDSKSGVSFPVTPETVGQYTGLKDKNGVEIYEGGIVKVCNNNKGFFEVIFINAYVGGWVLKHKDLEIVSLGARKETDVEIIGNVHQNPELL